MKAEIDQKKLDKSDFTYCDLISYHYMIISFFMDFGRKEVSLLQDLWHEKVSKLINDLHNKKE